MPSSSLHYPHPTSKVTDWSCSPRWPSRVVTTTRVIIYTINPLNRISPADDSAGALTTVRRGLSRVPRPRSG